ncbi:hypothetical protein B0O99DRAFT_648244 [Bisporella sp. PMI_857]|nr:hypothetical protein B0O99DRAFT_648244 [Bisporella sp. PMI_857]
MGLTKQEIRNLIVIERVTASVSVLGTLSLLATFVSIKDFRTLSNTIIFWASFANLFANIAALIGGSALSRESSPLCQFQGFLLEMFMQSDPMWSLAMAVNVYLVFFHRYDALRLKKLYWLYGILCYGIPFIPAMVCLLLRVKGKGQIYGNATLWCWIDNEWAPLRIYSYYAPVWLCILASLIIYTRVGIEIFQKRSELQAAGNSDNICSYNSSLYTHPEPSNSPFTGLRTTEIHITHRAFPDTLSFMNPSRNYPHRPACKENENYTVTISAKNLPQYSHRATSAEFIGVKRRNSMDKVKWAYFKVAMLFAVSILITWVPASVNRVHGLRHPRDTNYLLNIGSALVLPLQGFWNTVIYFTTSLGICGKVWRRWSYGTVNSTGNRGEMKGQKRGERLSNSKQYRNGVLLGGERNAYSVVSLPRSQLKTLKSTCGS